MPSCLSTAGLLGLGLLAAMASPGVHGAVRGVVGLDTLTFDKIVDGAKTVLLKIDKQYPYGDQEDAFKEFVKDVASSSLVVAEVGVQDHGDKENDDIREKFEVDAENFPAFFLFKEGTAADGTPIKFDGDVTTNGLKRFVTVETGIWIGLAGTLEAFDKIAASFISAAVDLAAAAKQMKAEFDKLEEGSDAQKTGKMYTIIMGRIAKKAEADGGQPVAAAQSFLAAEISRISRLLKGKLTDAKKAMLDSRLNILASFAPRNADAAKPCPSTPTW